MSTPLNSPRALDSVGYYLPQIDDEKGIEPVDYNNNSQMVPADHEQFLVAQSEEKKKLVAIVSVLERDNLELSYDLQEMSNKILALNVSLADIINVGNEKVAEHDKKIIKLQEEIDDLKKEKKRLENAIIANEAKSKKNKERIEQLDKQNRELNERIQKIIQEKKLLADQLKAAEDVNDSQSQDISSLKNKIESQDPLHYFGGLVRTTKQYVLAAAKDEWESKKSTYNQMDGAAKLSCVAIVSGVFVERS